VIRTIASGSTLFKMIQQIPYRCPTRQGGWIMRAPIKFGWIKLTYSTDPRYPQLRGCLKFDLVRWTPKTLQTYQFTPSLSQLPGHGIEKLKVGPIPIGH